MVQLGKTIPITSTTRIANEVHWKMKTRIVAIIIAGIVISSLFVYLYDQMYDCLNHPMWMKHPRQYGLDDCLQMYFDGTSPDHTQAREDHAKEQSHREKMIGLFSDTPEVVAFYSRHEDANFSVRDDHVSYFAGKESGFQSRMNLHYGNDDAFTHMSFYCFNEGSVQYEVSQEDILHHLENNDCIPEKSSSDLEGAMSDQGCASLFDESWYAYAKETQSSGVQWEPPSKQDVISGSEFFGVQGY